MLHLSVVCRFSLANIDKTFQKTRYYSNKKSVIKAEPREPKDPRYALKVLYILACVAGCNEGMGEGMG